MAIVRMKKLSLLAARSQRRKLLKELMSIGCVQLHEQTDLLDDPETASLLTRETSAAAEWRARRAALADSIKLLDKYAPKKSSFLAPKPEVNEAIFTDETELERAEQIAREIISLDEKIRNNNSEEARVALLIEALKPWRGFELPLETNGTKQVAMLLGTVPAVTDVGEMSNALTAASEETQIFEISSDESLRYLSVFFMRSEEDTVMPVLREHGFAAPAFGNASGTAADNIAACEKSLVELREGTKSALETVEANAVNREMLKLCYDRAGAEVDREEAAELMLKTEKIVCLEGWVAEPKVPELEAVMEKYDCAYELTDPDESEYGEVPVQLKNNKLTDGLNMVTNMYSLPKYGTLDPNPLIAPFFILFYGIMMADMGYGIVMMLIGLVILKKKRPKEGFMKYFAELMIEGGFATFVMGAITGGFFGDAPLQVAKLINPNTTFEGLPSLFDPLNDTIYVLGGAMVLGFIQLVTGMVISFVYKIKHGQVADAIWGEATEWVLLLGIILAVAGIGSINGIPVVLIIGAVLMIYAAGREAKGFGKVTAVFGKVYNLATGWFGDILSYSRLMALMLAGSVIAQVFNTLGALPGNFIVFAIIFILGHLLNFGLNLLGCYVHDLRLQCLEYFGKFYQDGGKPFRPLRYNTKYVDVVNK